MHPEIIPINLIEYFDYYIKYKENYPIIWLENIGYCKKNNEVSNL
jgi:hypothetical protein